jgi:hypothetical protein
MNLGIIHSGHLDTKIKGLYDMSNNVKVKGKIPEFNLDAKDYEYLSQTIIDMIKDRTSRGLDNKGKAFKPYSMGYVIYKKSDKVDLKLSGDMLNSMRSISSGDNAFKIEITGIGYAERVLEERPILGLTTPEKNIIKKKIIERILK